MSEQPFWQQKTLDEMTDAEWESLCDGCGQCCLHKLMDEDTDEIYFTNVACRQLNIKTCQCRNYGVASSTSQTASSLPAKTCQPSNGCRRPAPIACWRRAESLPAWHPLLTGSKRRCMANASLFAILRCPSPPSSTGRIISSICLTGRVKRRIALSSRETARFHRRFLRPPRSEY